MQTPLTTYTRTNRYSHIIMSVMLMLALTALAVRAQDSGASPAQSAPSTSTAPSTTTSQEPTTTTTHSSSYSHEVDDGLSTNTWILIGIGIVVLLVFGIMIGRSSRTKETVTRTTVIK
jgi:hypothetical protein